MDESDKSTGGILKQLTSGLPFLGLIVIIIESLLLTAIVNFPKELQSYVLIGGIGIMILFAFVVIIICIKYPQFVNVNLHK